MANPAIVVTIGDHWRPCPKCNGAGCWPAAATSLVALCGWCNGHGVVYGKH